MFTPNYELIKKPSEEGGQGLWCHRVSNTCLWLYRCGVLVVHIDPEVQTRSDPDVGDVPPVYVHVCAVHLFENPPQEGLVTPKP